MAVEAPVVVAVPLVAAVAADDEVAVPDAASSDVAGELTGSVTLRVVLAVADARDPSVVVVGAVEVLVLDVVSVELAAAAADDEDGPNACVVAVPPATVPAPPVAAPDVEETATAVRTYRSCKSIGCCLKSCFNSSTTWYWLRSVKMVEICRCP